MAKDRGRNFDRIQHEGLRRKIDRKFNNIHDRLEECYYKNWKEGKLKRFVSKMDLKNKQPLEAYNIRARTPNRTVKLTWNGTDFDRTNLDFTPKELFDKLHGALFHKYNVAFHEENMKEIEADRIPEEEYNPKDKDGKVVLKHVKSAERLVAFKNEGLEIDTDNLDDDSTEITDAVVSREVLRP